MLGTTCLQWITVTLSQQHFKHLQPASTASLPWLLANDAMFEAFLDKYSSENSTF